jgi:hypothetical protein
VTHQWGKPPNPGPADSNRERAKQKQPESATDQMPVGGRPAEFPSDMSLGRTTTPLIFVGAYFDYVRWMSS